MRATQTQTQKRKPMDVDDSSFMQVVRSNKFVVVDAWASWCGPCRNMLPVFEEVTAACLRKDVGFAKLHVASPSSEKAKEMLKIASLPTFIIFANGREVSRKLGMMKREEMVEWIDQHIGKLSQ